MRDPVRLILTSRSFGWITLAFIAFVIYGSLVPLTFQAVPMDRAWEKYTQAISQPVAVKIRSDWAANILLFIPLGFVAMGWRCVDRRRPDPLAIAFILLGCMVLSAAIEFTQIFFPPRDTSVNDIVAETLGGAIGMIAWIAVGQRVTEHLRQLWITQGERNWAVRLIPGYLVLLVFILGMPFDLTLSPALVKKKHHEGRVLLYPFTVLNNQPLDLVKNAIINICYFLPAGVLLGGLRGSAFRGGWAGIRVFCVGFLLAFAIECMQLIIVSRYFNSTDIITGSVAVLLGWLLVRLGSGKHSTVPATQRLWHAVLFAIWAAALLFINWEPFAFETAGLRNRFAAFNWLPFADYYAGNYLQSFDEITQKTALFLPFGLLLQLTLPARMGGIVVASTALAFAIVIEAGQVFLPGHHPGVSDLVIETFGAWIGCIIARRIRVMTSEPPAPEVAYGRAFAS